jgi:hypothetical protein
MIIQIITDSEYAFLNKVFIKYKIYHNITDKFVFEFNELIIKAPRNPCSKYATWGTRGLAQWFSTFFPHGPLNFEKAYFIF